VEGHFGRALEGDQQRSVGQRHVNLPGNTYDLFLRPAILNQRGGNNQAPGRMSEHIEAAILPIVRNWDSAWCDTFGIGPAELRSNDDVA
jgi:hypothetical protein